MLTCMILHMAGLGIDSGGRNLSNPGNAASPSNGVV
jgi:hypothetical protein